MKKTAVFVVVAAVLAALAVGGCVKRVSDFGFYAGQEAKVCVWLDGECHVLGKVPVVDAGEFYPVPTADAYFVACTDLSGKRVEAGELIGVMPAPKNRRGCDNKGP